MRIRVDGNRLRTTVKTLAQLISRLQRTFAALSRTAQIAWLVSFSHLVVLLAMTLSHLKGRQENPHCAQRISIHTVRPRTPTKNAPTQNVSPASQASAKSPAQHQQNLSSKPQPHNHKIAPTVSQRQKNQTLKQQVSKPKVSPPKETLQELAQAIEVFCEEKPSKKGKTSPPLHIPQWTSKERENGEEQFFVEHTYEEELTEYLQNTLKLPEHGEVKVSLSINPSGQLTRLEILSDHSHKNREFLQNTLATLCFPKSDTGCSLTITFKNLSTK